MFLSLSVNASVIVATNIPLYLSISTSGNPGCGKSQGERFWCLVFGFGFGVRVRDFGESGESVATTEGAIVRAPVLDQPFPFTLTPGRPSPLVVPSIPEQGFCLPPPGNMSPASLQHQHPPPRKVFGVAMKGADWERASFCNQNPASPKF